MKAFQIKLYGFAMLGVFSVRSHGSDPSLAYMKLHPVKDPQSSEGLRRGLSVEIYLFRDTEYSPNPLPETPSDLFLITFVTGKDAAEDAFHRCVYDPSVESLVIMIL